MEYACCKNGGKWTLVHDIGNKKYECKLCDTHAKHGSLTDGSSVHTFFKRAQDLCLDKIKIMCDRKIEGEIVQDLNVEVMHVYLDNIQRIKNFDFP